MKSKKQQRHQTIWDLVGGKGGGQFLLCSAWISFNLYPCPLCVRDSQPYTDTKCAHICFTSFLFTLVFHFSHSHTRILIYFGVVSAQYSYIYSILYLKNLHLILFAEPAPTYCKTVKRRVKGEE